VSAMLMAACQRPGYDGIEYEGQHEIYRSDFIQCRRLETLLCWESDDPADIVYAARAAGVTGPLTG
jgi:hypothetical protein